MLQNKKILIGITGGIAAYKVCELVRLLKKAGTEVKVIMTKAAEEFITPLTLQTLSGNQIYTDLFFKSPDYDVQHITLADWPDVVLIAPASANTIAKLAHGLADNLLTTVCLATKAPIFIVPAMNAGMWQNAVTAQNIQKLIDREIKILGPKCGFLACGVNGMGKMLEPTEVMEQFLLHFKKPILQNKTVIITAGPTHEPIDPVRYIGNNSSGKMGYVVAKAAHDLGANVHLISGPTCLPRPDKIQITNVTTADEMLGVVLDSINNCDIFVAVAAVADFKVETVSAQKIKKTSSDLHLTLIKNPDILGLVRKANPRTFVVGFAAETENLMENAQQKLMAKGMDMIVANYVGDNIGFNSDQNELTILTKNQQTFKLGKKDKLVLAYELMDIIAGVL